MAAGILQTGTRERCEVMSVPLLYGDEFINEYVNLLNHCTIHLNR